jgi:transcription elongation factor Elf1
LLTKEERVFSDNKKRCPRCKSEKYLTKIIQDWGNSMYAALEDHKTTSEEICQICGYNINHSFRKGSKPLNKIINWFNRHFRP